MRLFCTLGWHSPGPQILWNAGFWFTKCRDCERDLVRSRHRGWHVPVGAKVVWQAKAPAPPSPAEPPKLVEPPVSVTAVEPLAPDILIEAGKPPKRIKRAKPADPIRPAHLAAAPGPAAPIEPTETLAPVGSATPAHASEPSQPLAPAERLDLAQFVAEMLHSAGPAVPIQHAVLDDEPDRLADASPGTELENSLETDAAMEAFVSPAVGAEAALPEAALEESGEAAEELPEILVTDAPPPLELDEPLELVMELGPDQLETDQFDVPEQDESEADRESRDAVAELAGELERAEDDPSQADATLDAMVDPAAAGAEPPPSPAAAEPVPAAPAPAPAVEIDPWADFLDDHDDDDADFAWAQESPPEPAPERLAGAGERRGAQRPNEPFRSDIDGRKRWSKNSVKR